ncbi:MAG: AgmX/PglI C-terminal domain-containing protein [Proteobacteria bacterium]|nr:AgmX/PglI C-terminal domain-containing protein [Pseudomonadota bacterium]
MKNTLTALSLVLVFSCNETVDRSSVIEMANSALEEIDKKHLEVSKKSELSKLGEKKDDVPAPEDAVVPIEIPEELGCVTEAFLNELKSDGYGGIDTIKTYRFSLDEKARKKLFRLLNKNMSELCASEKGPLPKPQQQRPYCEVLKRTLGAHMVSENDCIEAPGSIGLGPSLFIDFSRKQSRDAGIGRVEAQLLYYEEMPSLSLSIHFEGRVGYSYLNKETSKKVGKSLMKMKDNLSKRNPRTLHIVLKDVQPSNSRDRISEHVIKRIMKRHINGLKLCYEMDSGGETPSRMQIKYVISSKGAVERVMVSDTTLKNEKIENCITSAVKRILFPSSEEGGSSEVTCQLNAK